MGIKDIKVRPITDDDMVEISEWFVKRKWSKPPSGGMLPETGYVAEENGKMLSVGWLYVTNSSVGIIDWVATAPDVGILGLISIKPLLRYIEEVTKGAEHQGVNNFLYFTSNEKLAKYIKKKCGFKIAESGMHLCVRNRRG